jgi:branched-chain amino acid transport system substrate-binding protein
MKGIRRRMQIGMWSLLLVGVVFLAASCGSTTTSTTAQAPSTSASASTQTTESASTTASSTTTGGVIKIGATLPLSGWAASYGKNAQLGVDQAVKEFNDSGGIGGKKVEVIYEDTAADPKQAVTALQKLIEVDKVTVNVGTMFSGEALAQGPVAARSKMILVTGMASHPDITKPGPDIFMLTPQPNQEAALVARYAAVKLGLKRIAFFGSDGDYARAVAEVIKTEFAKDGAELLSSEFYTSDTTDFKTALTKAKALNPDGVYIAGGPADSAQITRQMTELGIKAQVMGSNMFMDPSVIEAVGPDLMEGVFCANGAPVSDAGKKFVADFITRYKAAHNGAEPPGITTYSTYDSALLALTAMREVGEDTDKMAAWIANVKDFPMADGELFSFDANRHALRSLFITIYQGGKWVVSDFHI